MSFEEVDRYLNDCIFASRAAIKAAAEADLARGEAIEFARKAARHSESAVIYAVAEAELLEAAAEYHGWEQKFDRKGRLFDDGGMN